MGRNSQFSREEKIAAVEKIEEGGRTATSVAHEYGVHENTINKWRHIYRMDPEKAFNDKIGGEPIDENERLKLRVRELENEVAFLKKVSAYFAKNPR